MKKTWLIALALMMMLTVLCTACGGSSGKEAPATAEPEATEAAELPSVTAPPANGDNGQETGLAADENTAPEMVERADWLATLGEKQRLVEETLIGHEVEELYAAIGEPISAEYTTSCLVADGEDGILTYDGFIVSTTRNANGTEYVMGTDN